MSRGYQVEYRYDDGREYKSFTRPDRRSFGEALSAAAVAVESGCSDVVIVTPTGRRVEFWYRGDRWL